MKKRLCSLLLAGVLLLGCSASRAESAKMEKYDPPIVVSIGRAESDPNEAEIAGQTSEDNAWLDAYRDELGITFEDMFVVSQEKLNEKLNLQISIGAVPDFMEVDRIQFEMLVENGLAEDLTDYYEQYATDYCRELLNSDGGFCMDACRMDGRLYALPGVQGHMESASVVVWVRKDWLDNLRLPVPTTFEELNQTIRAFVDDDPDGNGMKDTYGLCTTNSIDEILGTFMSFHAYPSAWVPNEAGELVYGGVQPEVKNALAYLRELYEGKYLDQEFGVATWNQYEQAIANNQLGIVLGAWWYVDWPLGETHNQLGAEWIPLPIYSADDQPLKVAVTAEPANYYVLRKGYERPEAIVKMFNLWFDKAYGAKEDILRFHKNEIGEMPAKLNVFRSWRAHEDLEYYKQIRAALAGETVEMNPFCEMYYDSVRQYMDTQDPDQYVNYKMYGPDSASAVLEQYMDEDRVIINGYYGVGTKTMKEKWSYLETMRLETYVKIIMGTLPLDDYDQFVQTWNEQGGEAVTQEVRDWAEQR